MRAVAKVEERCDLNSNMPPQIGPGLSLAPTSTWRQATLRPCAILYDLLCDLLCDLPCDLPCAILYDLLYDLPCALPCALPYATRVTSRVTSCARLICVARLSNAAMR